MAVISESKQEKLDIILENVERKLEVVSDQRKKEIYWYLKTELDHRKTDTNKETIEYIILKISSFEALVLKKMEIKEAQEAVLIEEAKPLEEITVPLVNTHNSAILRFIRWGDHSLVINSKKQSIIKGDSVFIFRNWSDDLSIADIQNITSQIHATNPDTLIFIDQEGWLVNRYIDFESTAAVQAMFDETYVISRLNTLNEVEKNILRGLFPQNYGYYPSLWRIWVAYDNFVTETTKKSFVEIIAYIRLKSLQNNWINTYWLVADLNLWNPAITNASRSFSKHVSKYKIFIDAFQKASKETNITLYLKHFPGHGAWLIDSHKWILDLRYKGEYLKTNMELFEYFLDTKTISWGLMIAHIIIPDTLSDSFSNILAKADYILTDDLAMQWFKQMVWIEPESSFFSSHKAIIWNNVIKVDTQYVESVY